MGLQIHDLTALVGGPSLQLFLPPAMTFERIQHALDCNLLNPSLCEIVLPPTEHEIALLEARIGAVISEEHKELLLQWGGSNLDAIRINSAAYVHSGDEGIVFANDYDGYAFAYDTTGSVFAIDTDGGKVTHVAGSIRSFVNDVLLGDQGAWLYGQSWVDEVRSRGLA